MLDIQRRPGHQAVIKGETITADDLIILMTLTGNQDGVIRAGQAHGQLNGFLPIRQQGVTFVPYGSGYLFRQALAHRFPIYSRLDLTDDLQRVFPPGVIGGDDRHITISGGSASHQRPFTAVPVAPTTKNSNDPAAAEFHEILEHAQQGIGGMGVINENGWF